MVIGKPVDEAMSIHQTFLELMQGKGQVEPDEDGVPQLGRRADLVEVGVLGAHRRSLRPSVEHGVRERSTRGT